MKQEIFLEASQSEELICLGRRGENRDRVLHFGITSLTRELGEGGNLALHIRHERIPGETVVSLRFRDNLASWRIDRAATAEFGRGRLWLTYQVGEQRCRSATVYFFVTL